jgi:phytanoyl-CoA hydroxylase
MTDEQQIEYEAQGYLVIDDALGLAELDRVRNAFERAEINNGLEDLPNRDDAFIHLAEHPVVFPSVHRIVGDNVQVRSLRGLKIEPDSAGRGWHRELGSILGVHHPNSTIYTQVFFHLDNVPENGSCLAVVPGSHRFKAELPFPDITYIEEMPHHVPLRVAAGSAVVLHGNIWQARTRNRSITPQRFLEYNYIHCWMRQALPTLTPHATEVVSSTHNLSQLFGIRTTEMNANWYWGRKIEGYPSSKGLPERKFSPLSVVGKGTSNS